MLNYFQIELRKITTFPAFRYGFLLLLGLPFGAGVSYMFRKYDDLLREAKYSNDLNPWFDFYSDPIYIIAFLLPIICGVMASLQYSIEEKGNYWKYLFSLPISRWQIFVSKFCSLIFCLFLLLFSIWVVLVLSANVLAFFKPTVFAFKSYNSHFTEITLFVFKLFLYQLGILSICFYLTFRFKNSLSLNIFVPIFSFFIYGKYSPFNPFFMLNQFFIGRTQKIQKNISWGGIGEVHILDEANFISLLTFIVFSYLSFQEILKKN